jgi:DNA (cytosine-5)-methyltransferase 1
MTRIGSICTGYAGLDAAVREVIGGELAFVADIDPDASKLLAHRFPDVPNLGDIKAVDWVSLGTVEIFGGGFPCQDVSAAGARAGLKRGNRSGLWHEFATAIDVLRPRLVVIENVDGLLSARGDEPAAEHLAAEASRDSAGWLLEWLENELELAVSKGDARRARQCRARTARVTKLRKRAAARCQWHERRLIRAIGTVLGSLAALGYDAEWIVVTASAAGACHRRARLFILAFPAGARAVAGVPIAVFAGGTLTEPGESLFGVLPFTGRIPASGRMAGGRIYAAEDGPTAMAAGLLKTPTAQLAINGGSQHPDKRRAGGHGPTLADQVEHELLPTPTAREKGGRNARHGDTGHGDDLPEAIMYLPTPNATDGKGGNIPIGRMKDGRPRTAADADLPAAVALLPTPRATDGTKGGPNQRGSSGDLMLPSAVMSLLPTPQATDGQGGPRAVPETRTHRGTDHGPRLRDMAPALLPTPSVADGTGGHKTRSGDRKGEPLLGGIEMLLPTPTSNVSGRTGGEHMAMRESIGRSTPSQLEAAAQLLPTPTAMDSHGARNATANRKSAGPATNNDGWTLSDVLWTGDLPDGVDTGRLLPTPSAGNFNDGEDLASWEARRQANLAKGINGNGQGTPLPVAAQQIAGGTDWGPYEAAVRRWEAVLGRPAPRPTVPGKTSERLNPALPEWMMGLPAGWITEVPGLSRNAQLKLAGNGVVIQQAELAVRILLGRAGLTEADDAA